MSNTFSIGAHRVPGGSSRLMFSKGGANSVAHGTTRQNNTTAYRIFMLCLSSSRKTQSTTNCAEVRVPKTSVFWGSNGWPDVGILLLNYFL